MKKERLNEIINFLTLEEIDLLSKCQSEMCEMKTSKFEIAKKDKSDEFMTLYLTVRQVRRCYYINAKYDYEAYVTIDSPDGPRYAIDKIELHIDRSGESDNANYIHSCDNTDYCPKTDIITAYNINACGRSCVFAKGFVWGQTWSTDNICL